MRTMQGETAGDRSMFGVLWGELCSPGAAAFAEDWDHDARFGAGSRTRDLCGVLAQAQASAGRAMAEAGAGEACSEACGHAWLDAAEAGAVPD